VTAEVEDGVNQVANVDFVEVIAGTSEFDAPEYRLSSLCFLVASFFECLGLERKSLP
jgi:hypothetical protein